MDPSDAERWSRASPGTRATDTPSRSATWRSRKPRKYARTMTRRCSAD